MKKRMFILLTMLILCGLQPISVCAGAKEPGDKVEAGSAYDPILVECTGYIHGTYGSHGDPVQDGMIAGHPEWYGDMILIYKAEPQEDGGYKIGDFIEMSQVLDTGYGSSTGDGIQSEIRKDMSSRGTIETGLSIDKWCSCMSEAKDWMKLTGGHCFIQVIEGKG